MLRLHALRKDLAAEDGVLLYAVFTNEQLAQAAASRALRPVHDLRSEAALGFLIDHTYACRRGKGQIAALHQAMCHSQRFPIMLELT